MVENTPNFRNFSKPTTEFKDEGALTLFGTVG